MSQGLVKPIIAGGFGGVCFWASVYPIDVVKSRIQVETQHQSMSSVLALIIRTEGIRGLYKGLTPTLLRAFPSTAALFVTYEYTKEMLTKVADKTV